MQIQRLIQKKKRKRRISIRLTVFIIAGLSLVIGAAIWITNSNDGGNRWSGVLSVIFVAAGLFISLLQWLFPVSTDTTERSSVSLPVAIHATVAPTIAILPVRGASAPLVPQIRRLSRKGRARRLSGSTVPTRASDEWS